MSLAPEASETLRVVAHFDGLLTRAPDSMGPCAAPQRPPGP
ncbi:hypothetical protein OG361_01615 [Streptomyces sp. NBC_00090]